MILCFLSGPAGNQHECFLPLQIGSNGVWVPMSNQPLASADAAIKRCKEGLIAQLSHLEEVQSAMTADIRENVKRLSDRALPNDVVRVANQSCTIDSNGFAELPPEGVIWRSRSELYVNVDADSLEVFTEVFQLQGESRHRAAQAVDLILDEPLEMLAAVASRRPDALGIIAAVMARFRDGAEALVALSEPPTLDSQ